MLTATMWLEGGYILATSDYRQLPAWRRPSVRWLRVQLPAEGNSYEKVKWQFLTNSSLTGSESANDCFKTENSSISTKKKEKLKFHHNWELLDTAVMLPQLSCLLYSFHVNAVSPKYSLLWALGNNFTTFYDTIVYSIGISQFSGILSLLFNT